MTRAIAWMHDLGLLILPDDVAEGAGWRFLLVDLILSLVMQLKHLIRRFHVAVSRSRW